MDEMEYIVCNGKRRNAYIILAVNLKMRNPM
jgi:hypothetical protein